MNSVLNLMNSVFKTMNFVFKNDEFCKTDRAESYAMYAVYIHTGA